MSDPIQPMPPPAVLEAALLVRSWAQTTSTGHHWTLAGLAPLERLKELEQRLAIIHSDLQKCCNLREIATDAYRCEKAHRAMLESLLAAQRRATATNTPGDDAIIGGGE